ncbi:MAG: hypothetical protein U9O89_05450 [Thermoproteota archaeon]|nr:hypothetical protein [Thermoproteota archaeon]
MPATSIDTFFASSLMIILVLSAMVGLSRVLAPYVNDFSNETNVERYRQLSEYLLLNPGSPQNWGSMFSVVPNGFGLAKQDFSSLYELDIDKVSRLNQQNVYSISYPQLLESLGISDVALNIELKTIFDISINLVSSTKEENETAYNFEVSTAKSGLPVSSMLRCYVAAKNYVSNLSSSTSSAGIGSINVAIPNSANGTALLVVFAKAKVNSQIMSFNVYAFSHNSTSFTPNRTFTQLNPLNYTLNVSFSYTNEKVLTAQVFSYDYHFNLTQTSNSSQSIEYSIPRLLDASPMVLIITGFNASTYFAEWTSYPQLPTKIGATFSEDTLRSAIVPFTYVVNINLVLYRCNIKCGGPAE